MVSPIVRSIVIGLGIQGRKRKNVLEARGEYAGWVDTSPGISMETDERPFWPNITQVPLESYDAAMVCVPPDQKPAICEYLAANKKHMLIEKPLLGADSQLRKLGGDCHRAGVVAYVAYNHRFEPMIVRLKELIDSGDLGDLYHCRMFYGNGTAEDVRASPWRDSGYGVMAEIGTHLIDLEELLFRKPPSSGDKFLDFIVENGRSYRMHGGKIANAYENKVFDHANFSSGESKPDVHCEVTYLSWKNTFTIDLIGSNGSAHLDGLTKWGRSTLTHRRRQRPPGVPTEEIFSVVQGDETWKKEYEYFKIQCERRKTADIGLERDIMINKTLEAL